VWQIGSILVAPLYFSKILFLSVTRKKCLPQITLLKLSTSEGRQIEGSHNIGVSRTLVNSLRYLFVRGKSVNPG